MKHELRWLHTANHINLDKVKMPLHNNLKVNVKVAMKINDVRYEEDHVQQVRHYISLLLLRLQSSLAHLS